MQCFVFSTSFIGFILLLLLLLLLLLIYYYYHHSYYYLENFGHCYPRYLVFFILEWNILVIFFNFENLCLV